MPTIKLTNCNDIALVSLEDFEFLSRFSWYAKKSRCGWYACTGVKVFGATITIRMHRLVMRCFSDKTVDHLDGDHYNNRQENLEIVGMLENVKRYYDKVPF
jgi:hypothetical protein